MTDYLHSTFDIDSEKCVSCYDELPLWSAMFGIRLLQAVEWRKHISALDIGFGTGFPVTELAMRLGNSSNVYGIDPWAAAMRRAREKLDMYEIKNTTLFLGCAEDIPLADHSIDLLVSNNGLNNVQDWQMVLAECARVAKPGAQFVHSFNLPETMIEFYTIMQEVLQEAGLLTELDRMHRHIHKKRRPLDKWVQGMEENHFSVKRVNQDRFDYQFADGTAFLNHYFIRMAFLDSWKDIIPKDRHVELFGKMEAKFNTMSQQGGLRLQVPFAIIDSVRI